MLEAVPASQTARCRAAGSRRAWRRTRRETGRGGARTGAGRYPSHLHINLVPRLQSGGHGRQLISTLIDALRRHGSRGVHLTVRPTNVRAIGFYRHVGFTQLPATDAVVFAMDLTS